MKDKTMNRIAIATAVILVAMFGSFNSVFAGENNDNHTVMTLNYTYGVAYMTVSNDYNRQNGNEENIRYIIVSCFTPGNDVPANEDQYPMVGEVIDLGGMNEQFVYGEVTCEYRDISSLDNNIRFTYTIASVNEDSLPDNVIDALVSMGAQYSNGAWVVSATGQQIAFIALNAGINIVNVDYSEQVTYTVYMPVTTR